MGGRSSGALRHLSNRKVVGVQTRLEAHTVKSNSVSLPCQAHHDDCGKIWRVHHPWMSWPQVDSFHQALKAYQERTGLTQSQVAKELGTSYGTLRFWLSGTRAPKLENMIKAATLFGVPVTDFMDAPVAGDMTAAVLDERGRFMRRVMGSDLAALTETEREAAFQVWKATVAGFQARK